MGANAGNNGISDQTLRWGGKIGAANVRATGQQQADDGLQQAFYQSWVDPRDSQRSRLVDVRADLQLNLQDELSFNFNTVRAGSQFGRPDRPTTDPVRDFRQETTSLGLAWRRTFSPDEEMALRFSLTHSDAGGPYQETRSYGLYSGAFANITYDAQPGGRALESELEFQHLLAPSASTRVAWGGAVKAGSVVSFGQFSTNDALRRSSYRLFGNLEYRPLPAWLLNVGASLEHDSIAGTMFDPRASVSYHLTPQQTLRLTASVAHRNPGLFEEKGLVRRQNAGTVSPVVVTYYSPGVEPERIESVELGYLGEFKKQRASLEVRAFHEKIPNRIHQIVPLPLPANVWTDDAPPSSRFYALNGANYPFGRADGAINIERAIIQGVEFHARWQPFDSTRLIYSNALMSIDAQFLHPEWVADSTGFNIDKISQQTRDSAPRREQSAMLIQQLPYMVTASMMYFQVTPMRWRRNSAAPLKETERYDFRLAKTFRTGNNRAELAYTVQMANGPQEERLAGLRFADRMHWLSLRIDF
jgi:iron complex outermembrane receptor protein